MVAGKGFRLEKADVKKAYAKKPYAKKPQQIIIKKRAEQLAFDYEVQALSQCACSSVQELIETIPDTLTLKLRYYSNAVDLLSFTPSQLPLFMTLLPRIIETVDYCHQQGWCHGDIKPSNVLYCQQSQDIILIDFAAALPIGLDRAELARWELTPSFALPERHAGIGVISPIDDWYALQQWLLQLPQSELTLEQQAYLQNTLDWLNAKIEG